MRTRRRRKRGRRRRWRSKGRGTNLARSAQRRFIVTYGSDGCGFAGGKID
jgi:hypothetical protein